MASLKGLTKQRAKEKSTELMELVSLIYLLAKANIDAMQVLRLFSSGIFCAILTDSSASLSFGISVFISGRKIRFSKSWKVYHERESATSDIITASCCIYEESRNEWTDEEK